MPQGLQVMDATGAITLDVGNTVLVLQGIVNTVANVAGSVTIRVADGNPWYIPSAFAHKEYGRPSVTLSGSTLSWTADTSPMTLFYGTY